jgi:hypothetical protein
VNALSKEFKDKLPSLLANMALVLVFGALGFFSSVLLDTVIGGLGYLSWLVFVLVMGIFLIRALSIILVIADSAIGIFITHLGIQEPWSRDRIAKDLVFIIVVILSFAALIPLLKISVNIGTEVLAAITMVAVGVIFVFIYDIGRTSWRILQAKVDTVTNRFGNNTEGDEK